MDQKVIDLLKTDLIRDEGVRQYAYQDSRGYWTIGVGRNVDRRGGRGLSDPEIMFMLSNDIAEVSAALRAALPWFDSATPNRQRALLNMAFNLGIAGLLKFKNALGAMAAGNWSEGADEVLNSIWAKQVGARAIRVADLIRLG